MIKTERLTALIFDNYDSEIITDDIARQIVFEEFDKASPTKILHVYDKAVETDDIDVIILIADYAISRIHNVHLHSDMGELFAICDQRILNSRQQG